MLTITPDAGNAIASLTVQWGLPETAGLRIQTRQPEDNTNQPALGMSMAELADPGDQVVTEGNTGARVFLDQPSAEFLDDKVLDAGHTSDGNTQFTLRAPGAPA